MFDTFIRFQARHRAHAPAIVRLSGETSFGSLDRMIDQVGTGLSREGAGQATLAAVRLNDQLAAWVVLLALARLGVGTLSFTLNNDGPAMLAAGIDLLVVDDPASTAVAPSVATIVASTAWVHNCLQQAPHPLPMLPLHPEAIGRVTLSSGTTGRRKAVARRWSEMAAMITEAQVISAIYGPTRNGAKTRLLSLFGLDTVVFYRPIGIWAGGGTLILADWEAVKQEGVISLLSPNLLSGSPAQIQRLIAALPTSHLPLQDLAVGTGGSHMPLLTRDLIRRRLAPGIWNSYGSSEAGICALSEFGRLPSDPTAAGWPPPGMEAEVVDEDDALLPQGRDGAIRVRGPTVVKSYLNDEEATVRHFKHGWFYSGDIGSIDENGLVRVKGRSSELMNLGGVKVLPEDVEDVVRACPGVRDLAAFSAANELGAERLWLAVVRGEGFAEADVGKALASLSLPPVTLAWVEEIPRNNRGKIDRLRLRAAAGRR